MQRWQSIKERSDRARLGNQKFRVWSSCQRGLVMRRWQLFYVLPVLMYAAIMVEFWMAFQPASWAISLQMKLNYVIIFLFDDKLTAWFRSSSEGALAHATLPQLQCGRRTNWSIQLTNGVLISYKHSQWKASYSASWWRRPTKLSMPQTRVNHCYNPNSTHPRTTICLPFNTPNRHGSEIKQLNDHCDMAAAAAPILQINSCCHCFWLVSQLFVLYLGLIS